MARVQNTFEVIRNCIGIGPEQVQLVTNAIIIKTMFEQQRLVAEKTLCLEGIGTLAVVNGEANEPNDFFRGKFIVPPGDNIRRLQELTISDFDEIERTLFIAYDVLFYRRWNGIIKFFKAEASGNYTLYYYRTPVTALNIAGDFETPQRYDKVIEYGSISELAPLVKDYDKARYYSEKYINETREAYSTERDRKTASMQFEYNDV